MLDFLDAQKMVTGKMEAKFRDNCIEEYARKTEEPGTETVPFEIFCDWITNVVREKAHERGNLGNRRRPER